MQFKLHLGMRKPSEMKIRSFFFHLPVRVSTSSAILNIAGMCSGASWLTEWRRTLDWGLLGGAFFLIAIGLLMSLAAGPTAAARIGYADQYFFVFRQVGFASLGCLIMVAVSMLDRAWARRFATLVFIVSLTLMFFILIWGHEAKGAQRWLRIAGFSLQPSEMVKPALIVFGGWLLAQRELYPTGPWAVIAFLFYAVTLGLLLLQPDVGQSVLLTAAFVVTFFVSGLPWRWAAGFAVGGVSLSASLYALLPHVRYRVNSFINPDSADTYQIDRAAEVQGRGR